MLITLRDTGSKYQMPGLRGTGKNKSLNTVSVIYVRVPVRAQNSLYKDRIFLYFPYNCREYTNNQAQDFRFPGVCS